MENSPDIIAESSPLGKRRAERHYNAHRVAS
jgi:hypothetical protein